MGCDIHVTTEVRRNGTWSREDCAVDPDRNYSLFAALAGVRNGSGFAGVDTGDPVTPIFAPRGIPEDGSVDVQGEAANWDLGGHSHSYATLAELLAYDWTQPQVKRGIVAVAEWARWGAYDRARGDSPKSWCGGISGPNIEILSESEARERFGGREWRSIKADKAASGVHVRAEWTAPLYKSCSAFLSESIPVLLDLARRAGVGMDDVRIVYFFDN